MFLTSSTGDQCDENQTNPVKICLSQLAQQFAFFCMLLRIVSELAASISAPSLILTHSLELPCVPYYNNIHSLAEEVKLKFTRCKGAYQRDVFRKKKTLGTYKKIWSNMSEGMQIIIHLCQNHKGVSHFLFQCPGGKAKLIYTFIANYFPLSFSFCLKHQKFSGLQTT